LLAPDLSELLAEQPRRDVGRAAGRERHDEADRLLRPTLCRGPGRGEREQRGPDKLHPPHCDPPLKFILQCQRQSEPDGHGDGGGGRGQRLLALVPGQKLERDSRDPEDDRNPVRRSLLQTTTEKTARIPIHASAAEKSASTMSREAPRQRSHSRKIARSPIGACTLTATTKTL